jgi:integrase
MEGYLPPSKDRKGTRTLSDDELKAIWQVCTSPFGDLIKLLILWGTRKGETGAIRRDWIENGVLTIPHTHTKNKRPHAIPLLPLARSILDVQKNNSPYFFPARWDNATHFHEGSWGKPKKALEKASGVTGWQIRDIRRTFRSNMPRLGVDRATAEILLNHAPSVLDEIYDRYERLDEKRNALNLWENHIQSLNGP